MILAADVFGNLFPAVVMEFWVPALVVGGIFVYLIYKFLQKFGYIDW